MPSAANDVAGVVRRMREAGAWLSVAAPVTDIGSTDLPSTVPRLSRERRSGFRRQGVGRRHHQADQIRKRRRARPLHYGGTMVLDRALADAEVVGDYLIRTSFNDEVQDVAFARRQAGETCGRRLVPSGELCRIPDAVEGAFDACQQFVRANGFLQEVDGAGLHRFHRHRYVAMAGHHDRRQAVDPGLEPFEERDSAYARHQGIDHEAPLTIPPVGREERLAAGIDLGRMPVFLKQFLQSVADGAVVVDHENRGPRAVSRYGRMPHVLALRLWLRGKEGDDLLRQRFRLRRLAEMDAAGIGDLAQGVARYVTGEDDGRYFAAQRLAQPRDDLGTSLLPRQI